MSSPDKQKIWLTSPRWPSLWSAPPPTWLDTVWQRRPKYSLPKGKSSILLPLRLALRSRKCLRWHLFLNKLKVKVKCLSFAWKGKLRGQMVISRLWHEELLVVRVLNQRCITTMKPTFEKRTNWFEIHLKQVKSLLRKWLFRSWKEEIEVWYKRMKRSADPKKQYDIRMKQCSPFLALLLKFISF